MPFFYIMEITTYPTTTAITLAEAKAHLRIADSASDTEIANYIDSAQILMFNKTSVLPAAGVVTFYARTFDSIPLDAYKIASVVVKYQDTDNAEQTLSSGNYDFNANDYPYSLDVTTQPSLYSRGDAVKVECTIATSLNPMVLQAIKMIVGDLYELRQSNVMGVNVTLTEATNRQLSLISKRIEI